MCVEIPIQSTHTFCLSYWATHPGKTEMISVGHKSWQNADPKATNKEYNNEEECGDAATHTGCMNERGWMCDDNTNIETRRTCSDGIGIEGVITAVDAVHIRNGSMQIDFDKFSETGRKNAKWNCERNTHHFHWYWLLYYLITSKGCFQFYCVGRFFLQFWALIVSNRRGKNIVSINVCLNSVVICLPLYGYLHKRK